MDEVDFYLEDLKSKFNKIDPHKYYLSYSGGKDSHLLLWFIKEYAKIDGIEIVGCNTYMEHPQILKRIYAHSDVVLLPAMKPFDIKERFGIPCFSKEQDYFIYLYQNSIRKGRAPSRTVQQKIDGTYPTGFKLSKKAVKYILSENPHRISNQCCQQLKKKPFHKYERGSGRKPILGVRSSESLLRRQQYGQCFTKSGKFTPLHDLTDELLQKIIVKYNIEVPEVYDHVTSTGCMGCPYGSWKHETEKELEMLTPQQRAFTIKLFKESYDVLRIKLPNE